MKSLSYLLFLSLNLLAFILPPSYAYSQTIEELKDEHVWDIELLQLDIATLKEPQLGMMTMGAFPVKHYEGSAGVMGHKLEVGEQIFKGATYFVGKNEDNKHLYDENQNQRSFFTILCPIDNLNDSKENQAHVISRNHPNYIGQGLIHTGSFPVEYITFTEGNDRSYAILNMKIFNLDGGNTILVDVQPDKSLRFLQLQGAFLSMEDSKTQVPKVLETEEALNFYNIKKNDVQITGPFRDPSQYQDKIIEVKFHHKMTALDLVRIKNEMKEEEINITYHETKFNPKGELISISFSVKTDDGCYYGSASSKNVFLSPTGFYRDYRKHAKTSFGTGTMN